MDEMIKCQYAKVSNDYDLVILRLKFVSFEETEEFLQRIVLVGFSSCLSSYGSQYNVLPQRLGPISTYFSCNSFKQGDINILDKFAWNV